MMDFEHNGGVTIVFDGHSFAKIVSCGHDFYGMIG